MSNEEKKEWKPNVPIFESTLRKSNDGKWYIHKMIQTTLYPANYIKKMVEGDHTEKVTREFLAQQGIS